MEVKVVRSGGQLGRPEEIGDIDTEQVEGGERIEQQVETIGFWEMPEHLPGDPVPDGYSYEVTVTSGRRRHSVSFSEGGGDENRRIAELVSLVEEAAQAVPSLCEWSAWYNRMPGAGDENLHVAGRCNLPEGATLRLEPGNVGAVPDPELFSLQATIEQNGGYGGDPSWVGEAGPDIKHVRIQGDVSTEIDVTIAQ